MKLLPQHEAKTALERQYAELRQRNTRLLDFLKGGIKRLNDLPDNHDADKQRREKEFEVFCQEINRKKSEILGELTALSRKIEEKRAVIDGIMERQDVLDEREAKLARWTQQLTDRERFIKEIEEKQASYKV